jgi:anaerobic magnesium-protoporphyrin IX monomethyl ester cyclase
MYVTPHSWTSFGRDVRGRRVVQPDQSKWDYRHQVLAQERLHPWQLFLAMKWLELCFHLSPRRFLSIVRAGGRGRRRQQFWVFRHIALVWIAELVEFFFRTSFAKSSVTLTEQDARDIALASLGVGEPDHRD